MKSFIAECGEEKIRTVWTAGHHKVRLGVCKPNKWNPNEIEPHMLEKVHKGISETYAQAKRLPPILVRPHPRKRRKVQIIDGQHRWEFMPQLGLEEIEVFVLYVDEKTARLMTGQLNWNRGEPNMEKYPQYYADLISKFPDVDPQWLSERLPESKDEIDTYLQNIDFEVEEIKVDLGNEDAADATTKDASDADALVEMKFLVRQAPGEVIERELSRLCKALGGTGKNLRGRALEMMAVQSSQTPDSTVFDKDEEDDSTNIDKKWKKKRKLKLKNK